MILLGIISAFFLAFVVVIMSLGSTGLIYVPFFKMTIGNAILCYGFALASIIATIVYLVILAVKKAKNKEVLEK
jgi:hypothetical protein